MADIQSNIIPNVNKAIESAQSNYAASGLPTRANQQTQSNQFTLTVLANQPHKIVLQEHASAKRISVDKASIVGIDTANLQQGDKLVFLATKTTNTGANANAGPSSIFYIEKAALTSLLSTLPEIQTVSNAMKHQWRDIASPLVGKIKPDVVASFHMKANSPHANQALSNVISIAQKNGKPLLPINVQAAVSFVDKQQQVVSALDATAINLRINSAKSQTNIYIPAIQELVNKLPSIKAVSLKLHAQSLSGLIESISFKGAAGRTGSISQQTIASINQFLHRELKQPDGQLQLYIKRLIASPESTSLQEGLVIDASNKNVRQLGSHIQQGLSASLASHISPTNQAQKNIADFTMGNNKLLIASSPNSQQISIYLIQKPTLLDISNKLLLPNSHSMTSTNIVNLKSPTNDGNLLLSPVEDTGKLTKSGLLNQLEQKQLANDKSVDITTSALKAKLASDLKHVLPHSQNLQSSMPNLQQSLTQLIGALGKDDSPDILTSLLQAISGGRSKRGMFMQEMHSDTSAASSHATNLKVKSRAIDMVTAHQLKDEFRTNPYLQLSELTGNPNTQNNSSNHHQHSTNSIVNGLVSMLQTSLYAKLFAQHPQLSSKLLDHSKLIALLSSSHVPAQQKAEKSDTKVKNTKLLNDIAKFDNSNGLISSINKVLSKHSMNRLASSEASLQGQDSFFYSIPNMFSPAHRDIEIKITREQHDAQSEQGNTSQQVWDLNMRLDVGEQGDVLAKVKLVDALKKIDLNLYASNQTLKDNIMNVLPLLNRRLKTLGFDIEQRCYVGKIPDNLYKTDFQVVQAYV